MNNNGNNLAIKGYDPVAYFSGKATLGDPMLQVDYDGSTYYFSSESNKVNFEGQPDRYIPAFGGFCATAMSEGKKFDINPTNFKIKNDQLLLFYLGLGGDTKAQWEENEDDRLASAKKIWAEGNYV